MCPPRKLLIFFMTLKLDDIPDCVLVSIFSKLPVIDLIVSVSLVSRRFRRLIFESWALDRFSLSFESTIAPSILLSLLERCPSSRALSFAAQQQLPVELLDRLLVLSAQRAPLLKLRLPFASPSTLEALLERLAAIAPFLQKISIEGAIYLDSCCLKRLLPLTCLTHVDFNGCTQLLDEHLVALFNALPAQQLVHINLDGVQYMSPGFALFLPLTSTFTTERNKYCIYNICVLLLHLYSALAELCGRHGASMRHLSLDGELLEDPSIEQLVNNCRDLTALRISFCTHLSDRSLLYIRVNISYIVTVRVQTSDTVYRDRFMMILVIFVLFSLFCYSIVSSRTRASYFEKRRFVLSGWPPVALLLRRLPRPAACARHRRFARWGRGGRTRARRATVAAGRRLQRPLPALRAPPPTGGGGGGRAHVAFQPERTHPQR